MSTNRHKPSRNLQSILSDLLSRATLTPGEPVQTRLTNNLQIDIRVMGGIVALLISRSSVYPSDTEWKTICRHWPYPLMCKSPEKLVRKGYNGCPRHFMRCYIPQQQEMLEADRTHCQPVDVNSSDVVS
jgi:hypothetical protein